MAFRATNVLPAEQYRAAKELAVQLQRYTSSRSADWNANGANGAQVEAALDNLSAFYSKLDDIRAVPGIAVYAIGQEDDPLYDVATEFTALLSALATCIDDIVQAVPTSAGGFSDLHTWAVVDNVAVKTPRTFSAAAIQSAGIITSLDAVTAAVT